MQNKNLLVISNSFPNQDDSFTGDIFVKEQIKYLGQFFKNVYVVSPVAYGMERLRGFNLTNYEFDNIHVFFPKYFNNPLFWFYGRSLWTHLEASAINALLKKEHLHFDIIHAHFTWPSGAVAIELKRKYSTPVVITEHTSRTFQRAIKTSDKVFMNTWNKADTIIRVKQSDLSLFENLNISPEKIISIPNGYDSKKFHPLEPNYCKQLLDLPQDKKLILNVGNLYNGVKGHKYLIQAIPRILKERKDILCIIVGGGKLHGVLERQIHSLGLEKYVLLANRRPHDEIPLWLNACDLFTLPSLNEGNPTVLPEALGCGKPFVGTRVGGIPEVITSEVYGLLVEPADSDELAQKILIALERDWDMEAILRHSERYTWENISREIMIAYNQFMG